MQRTERLHHCHSLLISGIGLQRLFHSIEVGPTDIIELLVRFTILQSAPPDTGPTVQGELDSNFLSLAVLAG